MSEKQDGCEVPCKVVDNELKAVWNCLRQKVTLRLFIAIIIPLFAFVVVIIGGAQWAIYDKVNEIKSITMVHAEQLESMERRIDARVLVDYERYLELKKRVDNYHPYEGGRD